MSGGAEPSIAPGSRGERKESVFAVLPLLCGYGVLLRSSGQKKRKKKKRAARDSRQASHVRATRRALVEFAVGAAAGVRLVRAAIAQGGAPVLADACHGLNRGGRRSAVRAERTRRFRVVG